MTQTQELEALRKEVEELRKQLADMAIALAMRPPIYYYQPYYQPYQPVTPWPYSPYSPTITCGSGGEPPVTISGGTSLTTS